MLFLSALFIAVVPALAVPFTTTAFDIAPRETAPTASPTSGPFTKTESMTLDGVTNSALTIPGQAIPMVAVATCVQTAVPDAKGHIAPGECGAIWSYYPSFWAAIAVACLFGFLVAVHVLQAAMFKKVYVVLGHYHGHYLGDDGNDVPYVKLEEPAE
ncbi:C6 zinc finger domain protein [Metarhizium guizhouense ARSEF 977]|uniref:C6 zinc finger domain protein n=1 Tax=Metarhizium guizhouense (strain ARSEF 977) TaxID=1276136 RepID=A0A0B4H171_METGA|nr:C6 zinc finger domain protein [Metarhizium guizhouense ARSEF 977]